MAVLSKPSHAGGPHLGKKQLAKLASAAASWVPNIISHFPSTEFVTIIDADRADDPNLVPVTQFIASETQAPAPEPPAGCVYAVNVLGISVGPDVTSALTQAQQAELAALRAEFADVISESADDIGTVPDRHGVRHTIDTGGAPPQVQKPYKIASYSEEQWLREQLDTLLRLGVISPSTSAWMSPVVLVKKKNGDLRLCIDYRKLNAVTQVDPYPVPHIQRVMANMAGNKYYASLDCRSGYWAIKLDPADAHKTGFTTPFGNFQFNRTPFGLVNAGASYQRLADRITHDLPFCEPYIDDTFLFSKTWAGHIANLRTLLTRYREYGLKLNAAKCNWAASHIQCLGYIVGEDGIKVDPDKVSAVVNLPTPQHVSDVRSFVGMCSYYRGFIPNFAALAEPLQRLTKKGVPFEWDARCEAAFTALKAALTSADVLRLPDWSRPFILTTDWSTVALGAVLSQVDPSSGLEYPVAYASRALTPAESRYAPLEGECLALCWGIEKFHYYLYGREFTVHTDHHSLQWLNTVRFHNSKVERWALKLQEYKFTVVYKKGVDNAVADHLSRSVGISVARMLCHRSSAEDQALTVAAAPALRGQPLNTPPPVTQAAGPAPVWPEQAGRQSDLDSVPCTICNSASGYDNMVLCDGCERCFHLRCLTPPSCSVPSGPWLCPGCEPTQTSVEELCMPDTPLQYNPADIYLDLPLMRFVYEGTLPASASEARRVQRAAANVRTQAMEPHWPIVRYKPRDQPERWLLCPPVQYRWDLIRVFHCDLLAHSGVEQTLAAMHQHLHWPGIKADIASYIQCCDSCQRHKLLLPAEPAPQQPAIYGPFRHVHIDLAGPFTASIVPDFVAANLGLGRSEAKAYIVIMVDYFTKVAEFAVIYGKQSATIARAVWNAWLCRYGVPDHITCDNARDFDGDFDRLLKRQGVNKIQITPLHPAANGAAERLVRSLKAMLAKYVNDHPAHWIQSLPTVRMAYMTRLHSTLRVTPSQMLMGFTPKPPTVASNLFAANPRPVLVASASVAAAPHAPAPHRPAIGAASASPALAPDQVAYIDGAMDEELCAIYARRLGDYMSYMDGLADSALRRHSAKVAKRWLARQWKAKRAGVALGVGDMVLELCTSADGPFHHNVIGPFKIVGFTNHHHNVAILATGATDFRDSQRYLRHVSSLAKYYSIQDLRRQPPP